MPTPWKDTQDALPAFPPHGIFYFQGEQLKSDTDLLCVSTQILSKFELIFGVHQKSAKNEVAVIPTFPREYC